MNKQQQQQVREQALQLPRERRRNTETRQHSSLHVPSIHSLLKHTSDCAMRLFSCCVMSEDDCPRSLVMTAPLRFCISGFLLKCRVSILCCCTIAFCAPPPSVCRVHRASRAQRGHRKTKNGTEVAHVTRDSDTTFKVKRSKVKVTGAGHIVAASRIACSVKD